MRSLQKVLFLDWSLNWILMYDRMVDLQRQRVVNAFDRVSRNDDLIKERRLVYSVENYCLPFQQHLTNINLL